MPPPRSLLYLIGQPYLLRPRQLCEGRLLLQPSLIILGRVDHDDAAHEAMADSTELGAEHLKRACPDWREPEVGDRTRDHVHLGAEFRDVEIVQHIDRPEQYLDRLADRQMQVGGLDDHIVLVYPLNELAFLGCDTGQPHEALGLARRALAIARETGNRTIEGEATHGLGRIHRQLGEHEPALRHQHETLAVAEATADRILEAQALVGLGELHLDAGDHDAALARYTEALDLTGAIARPLEQAAARAGLGDVRAALGDRAGATEHWRLALTSYLDLGVPQADGVRARLFGGSPEPDRTPVRLTGPAAEPAEPAADPAGGAEPRPGASPTTA